MAAQRVTNSTLNNAPQNVMLLQQQIDEMTTVLGGVGGAGVMIPGGYKLYVDGAGSLQILTPQGNSIPLVVKT